jgi:hypothetical protein
MANDTQPAVEWVKLHQELRRLDGTLAPCRYSKHGCLGHRRAIILATHRDTLDFVFYVQCLDGCHASTREFSTPEAAARVWNKGEFNPDDGDHSRSDYRTWGPLTFRINRRGTGNPNRPSGAARRSLRDARPGGNSPR